MSFYYCEHGIGIMQKDQASRRKRARNNFKSLFVYTADCLMLNFSPSSSAHFRGEFLFYHSLMSQSVTMLFILVVPFFKLQCF